MSLGNLNVVGGKMEYSKLNLDLVKKDQAEYETGKIIVWINMLNEGKKPKRWNKPTKKGTGVHFTMLADQNEYEVAIDELQGHINVINDDHGLEIKLKAN